MIVWKNDSDTIILKPIEMKEVEMAIEDAPTIITASEGAE